MRPRLPSVETLGYIQSVPTGLKTRMKDEGGRMNEDSDLLCALCASCRRHSGFGASVTAVNPSWTLHFGFLFSSLVIGHWSLNIASRSHCLIVIRSHLRQQGVLLRQIPPLLGRYQKTGDHSFLITPPRLAFSDFFLHLCPFSAMIPSGRTDEPETEGKDLSRFG